MTPADVLDAAADLLDRDGWCQGTGHMPSGQRCVENALDSIDPFSSDPSRALYRVVGPVVTWNDTPGRTQEEVTSTLRRVARELREEG